MRSSGCNLPLADCPAFFNLPGAAMYLSSQEIQSSRIASLGHLQQAAGLCFDTTARFSDLLLNEGRTLLRQDWQEDVWLQAWPQSSSRMFQASCQIVGEAHQGLLYLAEHQVRLFDAALCKTLERLIRITPPEAEPAVIASRVAVEQAEVALHDLTEQACRNIELAEQLLQPPAPVAASGTTPASAAVIASAITPAPAKPRSRKRQTD
ncbi:MAG: hypothetical protein RIR00_1086 [Pseudomonadota bacterium]|jgi:hypothetical protein